MSSMLFKRRQQQRGFLARLKAFYAIEEEIRRQPRDLEAEHPADSSQPLSDEMRIWMEKAQRILLLKSETAAAIHHALSRWRALMCYIEDGMLQIDNSAAERVACPMLCTSENVRVAQR